MEAETKTKKKGRWKPALAIVLALLVAAAAGYLLTKELVIEMAGEPEMTLEFGEKYEEPGASAWYGHDFLDRFKKDVPVEITGKVDVSKLGTYTLTYKAAYGRKTAETSRTVTVQDTTPPVIELKADPDGYTLFDHPYEEEGFTAIDSYDGDLTEKVKSEEKDGVVYYEVADSSGNVGKAERKIVYDDRKGPKITLEGEAEQVIYAGSDYTEGYKAVDDLDGDVTDKVKVSGKVDVNTPGTYELTYTVSDAHDNESKKVRTITVKARPKNRSGGSADAMTIFLTFDDGPGPHTSRLIDTLNEYGAKATFFTTSGWPGYAYCMADAAASGHTVAVHTYSHEYSSIYASPEDFWADFDAQNEAIAAQTGYYSDLFRFPGGSSNTISRGYCDGIMTTLAEQAEARGLVYTDWNVDSYDAGGASSASEVAANVIAGVEANSARGVPSVVLQHDIKAFSVDAVEEILIWGLENGYHFEAMSAGGYVTQHRIAN